MAQSKRLLEERYLRDKTITIVDSTSAARGVWMRTLNQLRVSNGQVRGFGTLEEALEQNGALSEIVIAEAQNQQWMDLLEAHQDAWPVWNERVFILSAGDVSENKIVEFAQEDVDGFVGKPFTPNGVEKELVRVIQRKFNPEPMVTQVEEGKALFRDGSLDAALEVFAKAKKVNKELALPYYFSGVVYEKKELWDNAHTEYVGGLRLQPNHAKCLWAATRSYERQGELGEAFELAKSYTDTFPLSSDQLKRVVKLAIHSKNFGEVRALSGVVSHQDEELRRTLLAGHYVASKHYFRKGEPKEGSETLLQALALAGKDLECTMRCVDIWVTFEKFEDARKQLDGVDADKKVLPAWKLFDLLTLLGEGKAFEAVQAGEELVKSDRIPPDPRFYEAMAKGYRAQGEKSLEKEWRSRGKALYPKFFD